MHTSSQYFLLREFATARDGPVPLEYREIVSVVLGAVEHKSSVVFSGVILHTVDTDVVWCTLTLS